MTNYKKYALEKLEEWLHDVLSCDDVTPHEVYDKIKDVVNENYYHHKHQTSRAYELLKLLNGQVVFHIDPKGNQVEADWSGQSNLPYPYDTCGVGNTSEYCNKSWSSFWEEDKIEDHHMPPWGHSDMEALSTHKEDKVVKWQLPVEIDAANGEYFVTFPDDLLETANLKAGDNVEWVDNGDGSWTLKKL